MLQIKSSIFSHTASRFISTEGLSIHCGAVIRSSHGLLWSVYAHRRSAIVKVWRTASVSWLSLLWEELHMPGHFVPFLLSSSTKRRTFETTLALKNPVSRCPGSINTKSMISRTLIMLQCDCYFRCSFQLPSGWTGGKLRAR